MAGRAPRLGVLRVALQVRARVRGDWDRVLEHQLEAAEQATRGYMLARDAPARVTARSLFLRTEAYAQRWASEELKDYWAEHPRTPWHAYERTVLEAEDMGHLIGHHWSRAIRVSDVY